MKYTPAIFNAHKIYFPRYASLYRFTLYLVFILLVSVTTCGWIVAATSGCAWRDLRNCALAAKMFRVSDLLRSSIFSVGLAVLSSRHVFRSWKVLSAKGRSPLLVEFPGEWTITATRGIFTECSASVIRAQTATVFGGGFLTVSCVLATTLGVIVAVEEGREGVALDNLPGQPVHRVFFYAVSTMQAATQGCSSVIANMVLVTPLQFWSRTSVEAIRKGNMRRLRRLLFLPAVLAVSLPCNMHLSILAWSCHAPLWSCRDETLIYFTVSSMLLVVAQVFMIVWCVSPPSFPVENAISLRYIFPNARPFKALTVLWKNARTRVANPSVHPANAWEVQLTPGEEVEGNWSASTFSIGGDIQQTIAEQRRNPRQAAKIFLAKRYQQKALLLISLYLWIHPEANTIYPAVYIIVVLNILRASMLAMLVWACKDRLANFDDLESAGEAVFGLVVDAHQLCRALRFSVRGGIYPGRVNAYVANIHRMRDTMAVSYRWQPNEVEIAHGMHLNMSKWQIGTTADAITRSRALYGQSWQA